MALPKPRRVSPEGPWAPPPDDGADAFDERRLAELLDRPGVIDYHQNPDLANKTFAPIRVVEGSMTVEDLLRLLGRRDDADWFSRLDHDRDSDTKL